MPLLRVSEEVGRRCFYRYGRGRTAATGKPWSDAGPPLGVPGAFGSLRRHRDTGCRRWGGQLLRLLGVARNRQPQARAERTGDEPAAFAACGA